LDAVGDQSVDELVNLSFTATASDPDDPANLLAFSLSGEPVGACITPAGVFSWTPTEAQGPGSYSFDVVVAEINGLPTNLSDSESITVTVGEVNLPPVLGFVGNRAVDELVNLSFTATAIDPDDPANLLTFSLVGEPAGATITAGGVFSWTPTEAQGPGSYTFDVVVTETNGLPTNLSDSESITVTVGEDNLAPTLDPVGDQSVDELVNLTFTATATDPDDPANTLLFTLSGEPAGASITGGGDFSWTPTEAQGPGSYVFDVVVTETNGLPTNLSDSESITVTVGEVNLAPVLDAVGDQSVDELTSLSFTATASDPSDIPANLLTFSLSGEPAGATITAGGVFSWTPTEAQGPGSYTFDVVVTETNGLPTNLSDSETITVTVGEVNLAPVAAPIADASMDEETLFSLLGVASDADLPADSLTWSLDSGPGTLLPTGYYIYTPTEADGPGVYPVTFRVTDSGSPALSDTVSFVITVAEVNVAPVVSPPTFVLAEGGVLSPGPESGVLAGASDAEGNPISAYLDSPPEHGSLTLLPDGSFTYTHDGSEAFVDEFSFFATDGIDITGPTTVALTVDPVNDAPVLSAAVLTPGEDTAPGTELGSLTATDAEGDPVLFALTAPSPVFSIAPLTGVITLTAPLDYETISSFTVTVSATDPSGATDVVDVVVNVADIDEAPVAVPAAFPVIEDLLIGSTVGIVSASDPEGGAVSFAIVGGDPGGQFTIDPSSGELILVAPLDAEVTPTYLLDITASDPAGNAVTTAVIVAVTPAALLPPINAMPLGLSDLITLSEDTRAIVAPLLNDSDADGDPLLVSWIDAPVNGTLSANGDGTYTYQPNPNFYGEETLSYGISDGRGGFDTSVVVLSIMAVNDAPVAPSVNTVLEFTPSVEIPIPAGVYDPDGDAIQITVGTPDIGTVTLTDGVFVYTPLPEWNGTDTFTYQVADGDGGLSTGLITVRVVQIDGNLVALDLVTVEDVPPPSVPSSGIVVDTIKLLVGSVVEMGGLLGIPLLAVGIAFLGSILFGLSRNFVIGRGPVFLPATSPGNVAVVRVPTGGVLTALEGAGDEYPLVYRFGPAETGIRSTGRRAQRGSTRWIEVETPEGDAWVIDRFVTPTVPAGSFASDDRVAAALKALETVIAKRGDLTPLVSEHGLEIAYYASPKHFEGEDLATLLDGDASWGWWDPTGSTPSVRGEFSTIVADPLAESLDTLDGRAIAEAVIEIPVELVNFPNLTFNEPDRLGWRVFFEYEYEDETPKLAAIWREGVANPAAI
ncbi:MAG: tandem-95 repeat protein, partial [Acidimicrobiia bacterium]|nr:tandem-95 repeat protein [Acidimicrobiia bacterium]